ncbi:GH92 family glycosyl hydrolase [Porphyromonas macacae]|uniref:Alpha-1,2-mannosidase n=1 Tax=Porphyromonas macacae TaxID=28115 RepID=A0A379DG65_9PORP|nr:GH92 family glycosyl hydrolase [Porphyromonas macacae]SUB76964.1 Putative alpha-1,2-mannosidase [Porphyromonas macacae]
MIAKQTYRYTIIALFLLIGIPGLSSCRKNPSFNAALYVDPLIGTDSVGTVFPGASAPFGMVQLSPDNGHGGWHHIAGYYYPDSLIASFSHTHLSGTGAGDMYDIAFMPVTLPALHSSEVVGGYYARFSHDDEQCHAGYYSVLLKPYDIRVELTATTRAGVQQYTFLNGADSAMIRLDLGRAINWDRTTDSHIVQIDRTTLQGYRFSDGWARNQKVFFYCRLSVAPDSIALFEEKITDDKGNETDAKRSYAHLYYYNLPPKAKIVVNTAISGVDEAGAKANLLTEAPETDFEKIRQETETEWQRQLSCIRVEGASKEELVKLYTALYRAKICPTTYSDTDGRYLGADRAIHRPDSGQVHYSTFSLWDTYRAAHPLLELINTKEQADMIHSLIDFGEQNQSILPVWNMWASETDMMIGHHSIPVIVSGIIKGVTSIAPERLKPLLTGTTNRDGYRGMDSYRRLGYVAQNNEHESVSKTLEYACNDAAVQAWAKHAGDEKMAAEYASRSQNYRNLWLPERGFFAPRKADGSRVEPFNPFAYTEDYTESNAYQYLFSVQHDTRGLMELMGGREAFGKRLDEFFFSATPDSIRLPIFSTGMIGQYPHGNEPAHHVLFLYNQARQPWKATDISRKILQDFYTTQPDGLCGNEDCGQMSAWYVFTSLGFYPVDPVSGQYELVSPLYPRSEITLQNGKKIKITARNLSAENIYIESVTVNGTPWRQSYITYDCIKNGVEIVFNMTAEKGKIWY